jgi:hypothetical protein
MYYHGDDVNGPHGSASAFERGLPLLVVVED